MGTGSAACCVTATRGACACVRVIETVFTLSHASVGEGVLSVESRVACLNAEACVVLKLVGGVTNLASSELGLPCLTVRFVAPVVD